MIGPERGSLRGKGRDDLSRLRTRGVGVCLDLPRVWSLAAGSRKVNIPDPVAAVDHVFCGPAVPERPAGASLKLLTLVQEKGLSAIA